MSNFKFIGDADGHGPETLVMFGITFVKGEPTEVKDPKAEKKLSNNGHFEKVDGRSMRKPKTSAEPSE